jgi:hypothetical protein
MKEKEKWVYGVIVPSAKPIVKAIQMPHTKEQLRAIRKKQIKETVTDIAMRIVQVAAYTLMAYSFAKMWYLVQRGLI